MSDKSKYVPWIAGGFSALVLAIGGRYLAISGGLDTGTANLIFIAILIGVFFFFWVCVLFLEELLKPVFKRLWMKRPPREELPKDSPLQQKIDEYCEISNTDLGEYIAEEDLQLLHKYIAQYARGEVGNIDKKLETKQVDKFDLCHYGWNMWSHFNVMQQPETAQWLINVFALLDGEEAQLLYKKFTHNERYSYKIERRITK